MPSTSSPTRRRYLAAGVAAVTVGLAGCNGLLDGSDDSPTVDGLDGAWPQAGYDAANTGRNPDAVGPSGPVEKVWEFETDARSDWTPAVAEGSVYTMDEAGVVYAIDAADGSQRWRQSLGHRTLQAEQSYDVTYSVAVADGTVFANGRDLVALDAADGSELWRAEVGAQVTSPTVAEGTVYVGTHAGHYGVAAFDAAEGRKRWQFEPDHAVFKSAPAVVDGTVYASQSWTTGRVFAIDAADGTRQWRTEAGSSLYPSPVVADGRVLAVSTNVPRVTALEAGTGQREWRVAGEDGSFAAPAVRDGTVYYGEGDGTVRALDAADGSEDWRSGVEGPFSSNGHLYPSPVVAGGSVYFTAFDADLRPSQGRRHVYALDADGGTDLLGRHFGVEDWRAEGEGWPWSGPVVVDDALFVGTGKGVVALATEG